MFVVDVFGKNSNEIVPMGTWRSTGNILNTNCAWFKLLREGAIHKAHSYVREFTLKYLEGQSEPSGPIILLFSVAKAGFGDKQLNAMY